MAIKQIVFATVVAFFVLEALSATVSLNRRSVASNDSSAANSSVEQTTLKMKTFCGERSPCGWAVYNRVTRYIDYFMKNLCICDSETTCSRDDDDISITAYVYRCKSPNSTTPRTL